LVNTMACHPLLQALFCFFLAALVTADLTDEYDHAAYLDPEENYKLYWSVKDADKSIHFAVEVNTTGWVGFGISAGLSGNMKGADLVVGWVDSQGKGYLKDYHGKQDENTWPILDKKQDYDFVGSSESNSVTVLRFKRKLVTCDNEDRDIPLGTVKVIYAFGKDDTLNYHSGSRGARSLNLLNYVKTGPPPKTAKYFEVLSRNVMVPATRTTYWCQAFKLADIVTLREKQHIIEIEPLIEMKARGVVHHIIIYICKDTFNETHLNVTGSCYRNRNMPPSIRECAGLSVMHAWAIGNANFKYPDHVGWPIGAKDSMKFIVIETHFDNPTKTPDLVVTSGFRFYYDKPRMYDASMLTMGVRFSNGLIIPPKQENWISSGACTKACSSHINQSSALPGGEIKLFAFSLHAHTAGKGIWTKHIRNGKEIAELMRNDNYDFNYQQSQLLRKEVSFKAGDELITYCKYNTMKREDATVGGLSTEDEMCLNFILYYPRVDLSVCLTEDRRVRHNFTMKYQNTAYSTGWKGVKWNNTMVNELKTLYSYQGKDAVYSYCVGDSAKIHHKELQYRPTIKEPLPPEKDVCATETSNALLPMPNFIMIPFLAILVICKFMKI